MGGCRNKGVGVTGIWGGTGPQGGITGIWGGVTGMGGDHSSPSSLGGGRGGQTPPAHTWNRWVTTLTYAPTAASSIQRAKLP